MIIFAYKYKEIKKFNLSLLSSDAHRTVKEGHYNNAIMLMRQCMRNSKVIAYRKPAIVAKQVRLQSPAHTTDFCLYNTKIFVFGLSGT